MHVKKNMSVTGKLYMRMYKCRNLLVKMTKTVCVNVNYCKKKKKSMTIISFRFSFLGKEIKKNRGDRIKRKENASKEEIMRKFQLQDVLNLLYFCMQFLFYYCHCPSV